MSTSKTDIHPWIVTADNNGSILGGYSLRNWDEKNKVYRQYVTGGQVRMQRLADAMNRLQELEAVETLPATTVPKYGERGYVDPRHLNTEVANEEPAMPWCYCDHCKKMPFYTATSRVMHLTVSNPVMDQIRTAYLEWELGWVPFDKTLQIIDRAIAEHVDAERAKDVSEGGSQ